MVSQIASLVFVVGILWLFYLDRNSEVRTSKAVWIPTLWLLINGSRPVSQWLALAGLDMGTPAKAADLYLDGSPIDRNVFTFLLAAGLVVLVSRRAQVGPMLRKNGAILLFFSYCALSILWCDYPLVAFKHWIKGVGDVVMVLVVLSDPQPEAALKRFLACVGFLLVPVSVLFVKYYPNLGQAYNRWTWVQEYQGVTTTKNMLGMICLVSGLGSVWRLLAAYRDQKDVRRKQRLIAHGIVVAMALWLLSIAHSTTSLSCFLMASGLMVVTSLPPLARKPAVAHLAVAAMVAVTCYTLFFDSGGLLKSLGKDTTLTGRTEIWHMVLNFAGNPLVGTGYESFWVGERLERMWSINGGLFVEIQEAHNGYLEIFLNLGWVGITLLALLIARGYRNVIAVFRRDPDAGRIRLAYFAVGVVYSATEAGFRMMCPIWMFFLLAVTALPEGRFPVAPKDEFAAGNGQHGQLPAAEIAPVPWLTQPLGRSTIPAGRTWSLAEIRSV